MAAAIAVVHHRNAGTADGSLDPAAGNRKYISADLICISTVFDIMRRDIDADPTAFAIDQHHTGIAPFHISNVTFIGHIFALPNKIIVESIDLSHFPVGPAGNRGSAQHLAHAVRTGEIQAHGIRSGSDQRPGLVDLKGRQAGGGSIGVGVMGFRPQHQLGCHISLVIGIGISAGIAGTDHLIADRVAPGIIGNADIPGIGRNRQIAAG